MMNRELLIEYTPDFIRAALLEDGKLCEIHRERVHARKKTDGLYLGRVCSVRPAVGAAFLDIGMESHAFLPITDGIKIKCGDHLIVQGTAVQSVDTKGLRVSDKLNLAGKWLVLVPGSEGVRISKKIKDPALREALLQTVEPLCPDGCGLIVRTASADVTEDMLAAEIEELFVLWREIQVKAQGRVSPGLLHEPLDLVPQLIRDIGSTLGKVIVNHPSSVHEIERLREKGWLSSFAQVVYVDEKSCLVSDMYALDAQVDKALKKRVWLDCGGYLVFDLCEALTVIDVNSGKMILGRDLEDTALRVNLEAAREIVRQLRLRDIGGVIIVDFIDMRDEAHRQEILQVMRDEAKRDRSQVTVIGMTKLGLVEITRKRKNEQLNKALQTSCRVCDGTGHFLSADETAFRALRQVRRMILSGQRGPFMIRCAASVAAALEGMRAPGDQHLVYVLGEQGRHIERFEINQLENQASLPKGALELKR